MDAACDFTFSDLIAGYVTGVRRRATTASALQHVRRPRVRRRADRRRRYAELRPQPRRGVHRRDRPDARHARAGPLPVRLRRLLPRGRAAPRFEAKHIVFVGRSAERVPSSSARTGGSSRSASSPTSTCDAAVRRRARSTTATTAPTLTLEGDKLDDAPAGDRHDLAARLRLRVGLPADRRGPLPRGGREGHRVPARPHAHASTRARASPTGTTASTSGRRQRAEGVRLRVRRRLRRDPGYEQIYALAGPTQTYRITGDPRILRDVEMTHRRCSTSSTSTARAGRLLLAHRPDHVRARTPRSLGHNRARKNWNSVGDHAPAYLINLCLATGEHEVRRLPRVHRRHDRGPLPGLRRTARSCRSGSTSDWSHDQTWGWQQNRAVVGHNLKIAWNLMRINSLRPKDELRRAGREDRRADAGGRQRPAARRLVRRGGARARAGPGRSTASSGTTARRGGSRSRRSSPT